MCSTRVKLTSHVCCMRVTHISHACYVHFERMSHTCVASGEPCLTVLFPSTDRNRDIQQTKFLTTVCLRRPRGSMGFTQYSCLAQPELLKDTYILHALATKTESRPESFPVHYPIEGMVEYKKKLPFCIRSTIVEQLTSPSY